MRWLHRHRWVKRMERSPMPLMKIGEWFYDDEGNQCSGIFYRDAYVWDECACGAIRPGNMYDRDLGSAAIVRIHTMPPPKGNEA